MGIMDRTYLVRFLEEERIDSVLELSNRVYGDNYLSESYLRKVVSISDPGGASCSLTLDLNEGDGTPEKLIGFIITHPPGKWIEDFQGPLSKETWGFNPEKVAYFKCNTLEKEFTGKGIGTLLLNKSIGECRRLGASAGISHINIGYTNNQNYKQSVRAGARSVKVYPDRQDQGFDNSNYICNRCGNTCQCSVAEMILDFSTYKELSYV